jgi:hypothetical protein
LHCPEPVRCRPVPSAWFDQQRQTPDAIAAQLSHQTLSHWRKTSCRAKWTFHFLLKWQKTKGNCYVFPVQWRCISNKFLATLGSRHIIDGHAAVTPAPPAPLHSGGSVQLVQQQECGPAHGGGDAGGDGDGCGGGSPPFSQQSNSGVDARPVIAAFV